MTESGWSVGSEWRRWDPHIHAPGTLMNDQFGGAWDEYIFSLATAEPAPAALGITDYFTLRAYKEFLTRVQGQLPSVALVFPNVELRLGVETRRGSAINLHLLVSPEDPDHVAAMEERLARLTFQYRGEPYPCTDAALIRLGRAQPQSGGLDEEAALRAGANQFKVDLGQLRAQLTTDEWLRRNVLVAVAAGEDGLSGLSRDAGFRSTREELGRLADIVFSGQESDRHYWLGDHAAFVENKQQPKPCLHGSDAHALDRVLSPDADRRCWIRGDATFDSLRQALSEPRRRVHVGPEPPSTAPASHTIREVRFEGAPWITNQALVLNPGLVTVIGARGSGKTALADLLSFGAGAQDPSPGSASFLGKARRRIEGLAVTLSWGDGSTTGSRIGDADDSFEARVQYLSQQFVERLASPTDVGAALVAEIERVVFNSMSADRRLQATTFADLRDFLLRDTHSAQAAHRDRIREQTVAVASELELRQSLGALKARLAESDRTKAGLEATLKDLPVKGGDELAKKLAAVTEERDRLVAAITTSEVRSRSIGEVISRIGRLSESWEDDWRRLQQDYPGLLDEATWARLRPRIDPSALETLGGVLKDSEATTTALRELGAVRVGDAAPSVPKDEPARGLDVVLGEQAALLREASEDEAAALRRIDLERQLSLSKAEGEGIASQVKHAEGSVERLRDAQLRRLKSYRGVFEALDDERAVLEDMYRTLMARVASDDRLARFGLVVEREVRLEDWVASGEAIFDLRRPPFPGHGLLEAAARTTLLEPWATGTGEEVEAAMASFLHMHFSAASIALAQGVSLSRLGEWLFSTDHIRVRYAIEYEGVPLERLSPGTKGVVLLMLYLALDQWDLRPLVIDQPEENLDPRSVYSTLVPFFREAAARRQIIMVTHNANLVVATDSDQVIVANAHRTSPTELPVVTYGAGGLEDAATRSEVCRLLEGGEDAFRRRGVRYGVMPGEGPLSRAD